MMGTAVCALWGWGLMFWTPAFLQRTYSMTVGQAALVTQNMHLWGGGIATLVEIDRLRRRGERSERAYADQELIEAARAAIEASLGTQL